MVMTDCYICDKQCAQEYVFDDPKDIKCTYCDKNVCWECMETLDCYYSYFVCNPCYKNPPKPGDLCIRSKEFNGASGRKVVFYDIHGVIIP